MSTAINKAIVAILSGILSLLDLFGVVNIPDHDGLLATVSAVLTPVLVYLVPNKPT